jgi:hypothetical protein
VRFAALEANTVGSGRKFDRTPFLRGFDIDRPDAEHLVWSKENLIFKIHKKCASKKKYANIYWRNTL